MPSEPRPSGAFSCQSDGTGCYREDCAWPDQPCVAEREVEGVRKSDAKFKRKYERVARALAEEVCKKEQHIHELKRLEEVLVWIHRTEQPIEEIRQVIERTIPRRLSRGAK